MRYHNDAVKIQSILLKYRFSVVQCILLKYRIFPGLFQWLQCLENIQPIFFLVEADPPDAGTCKECRAVMVSRLPEVR